MRDEFMVFSVFSKTLFIDWRLCIERKPKVRLHRSEGNLLAICGFRPKLFPNHLQNSCVACVVKSLDMQVTLVRL